MKLRIFFILNVVKKNLFIFALIFLIGVLSLNQNFLKNIFNSPTAFAIGDLTVDWGVPEGSPIFVVNNVAPGQNEQRTVQVSNGASSPRTVGIRGIEATDSANMSDVMKITITEGITDLYGGTAGEKTLTQFFTESAGPNGVQLSTLAPGGNTSYIIKVKFDESAGNQFQNQTIIFDLKIGISIDLPAACDNITFIGDPIFGTSGNDSLNGNSKNNLIVTFEGNDVVSGGGGDDCIIAGAGADNLSGGSGNDVLSGEGGQDSIQGGSGNDTILGGTANDTLDGGSDNDTISGEGGNDKMTGGSNNDNLNGGDGTDSANGQSGTDTCVAETRVQCEI